MSQSNTVRDLVIERCKKIEAELLPGIPQNRRLANAWGRTHIATGLLTALCSSLSAVLTFSDNQTAVIVFALLSATLASGLTFLNPSSREVKRRTAEHLIRTELNRLEQDRILIMASSTSEQMMIDQLSEITKRSENLMKELIQFL